MVCPANIERVNRVDSCFIPHPSIKNAIDGIESSILLSQGAKEPVNVMLTGHAGTGKTTTCNAILSKHKRVIEIKNNCEVTIIPAFYSLIPSPVTTRGVASALLGSLGDPAPTRGITLDLTYRLGKLLKICETKVILLDELQHLLKRDIRTRNDNVKDWLKSIINQFKVPIVIVGTPECADIINNDPQLARRFTTQYELKNFDFRMSGKKEFGNFIRALSEVFLQEAKLDKLPDLNSNQLTLAAYAATGGNPADTTRLFKSAVLNALNEKRNTVEVKDFENAFNSLILPNSLITSNPFNLSVDQLASAITNVLRKGGVT